MPVFKGVIPVEVQSANGFDLYGQPALTEARDTLVKVVKFEDTSEQTGIRGEESGSHAKIDEKITVAELLFPPTFTISTGDIVTIFGNVRLQVNGVFPRNSLRGVLQHLKVSLGRKQ